MIIYVNKYILLRVHAKHFALPSYTLTNTATSGLFPFFKRGEICSRKWLNIYYPYVLNYKQTSWLSECVIENQEMTNTYRYYLVTELCKAACTIQASFRSHMKSKQECNTEKPTGEHSKSGQDKVSKQIYFDIKGILNRALKIAMMHGE